MNLKIPLRVGRILVVLALIVALLGSSIPVPARAVGFTPGLFALDATNLLIGGARALGIGPGSDPLGFNNLISDAKAALFDGVSPLVNVWLDYVDGGFRAFLSADFLARVLSFFFDSGSLVNDAPAFLSSASVKFGFSSYTIAGTSGASFILYRFSGIASSTATSHYTGRLERLIAVISPDYPSSTVTVNGTAREVSTSMIPGYRCVSVTSSSGGSLTSVTGPVISVDFGDVVDSAGFDAAIASFNPLSGSISTSEDLTLDSVSDSLSGSAYTDWSLAAQTIDEQQYYPVSIPSLSDSSAISAQTQAQAQAGTIPEAVVDEIIAGAEVDPDVVTLSDIFTAIRSLGADVVEAIQAVPAAIAAIFEPPVVYDSEGNVLPAYQISLTDFFPFCLPFDIYDLLSALAADPVAPVFEWTIAVPRWGISHDIEIDLSEWDSIARLFRTFELAAFVLGLALITREKFLRS